MNAKTRLLITASLATGLGLSAYLLLKPLPQRSDEEKSQSKNPTPRAIEEQLRLIESSVDRDLLVPDIGDTGPIDVEPPSFYAQLSSSSQAVRKAKLSNWAESLAEESPEMGHKALLEILESGHSRRIIESFAFVQDFSIALGAYNPDYLPEWMAGLPDEYQEHAARYAFRTLGEIDPHGAIIMANSLESRVNAIAAIRSLHEVQLENRDPALSQSIANQIISKNLNSPLVDVLAHHLGVSDANIAIEWLNQLDEESLIATQGWQSLVTSVAQVDMPAARRIAASIPTETPRQSSVISLATEWGVSDPQAALDWAISFSVDNISQAAGAQILPHWIEKDRQAALNWLASAPVNAETQAFLSRFRSGSVSPQ